MVERLLVNSKTNKQAGTVAGAEELTESRAKFWLDSLTEAYKHVQNVYELGLGYGVPKELARVVLPVARYSRMRATGNLRGWLGFLKLRIVQSAQWEIRQYADAVAKIVKECFPRTYEVARESVGMP